MKRTYPAWLGPNDYTREDSVLLKKLGGYRNAVLRRKRISARWKWYAQRGFPGSATQEVNLFYARQEGAERRDRGMFCFLVFVSICKYYFSRTYKYLQVLTSTYKYLLFCQAFCPDGFLTQKYMDSIMANGELKSVGSPAADSECSGGDARRRPRKRRKRSVPAGGGGGGGGGGGVVGGWRWC